MPRRRIPPSERTSQEVRALLSRGVRNGKDQDGEALTSAFVRLPVRRVIEELLEAEVSDVLGREYYRQGPGDPDPASRGYRNGYRPGRLTTAEGQVEYATPQVSDRDEPLRSPLRALLRGRTGELERLATEMYARGLNGGGRRCCRMRLVNDRAEVDVRRDAAGVRALAGAEGHELPARSARLDSRGAGHRIQETPQAGRTV